jgi:hypothetical protein
MPVSLKDKSGSKQVNMARQPIPDGRLGRDGKIKGQHGRNGYRGIS